MSTPSDLASAAKCYCFDDATERSIIVYLLVNGATNMTPSELAIAAKSYSYDLDTWKKVVVYLLDGNGAETPNALAEASKCFCFDNGAFKRIVAYLLNKGGGGGPCPQDMQVAWTPTNLKLGEMLSLTSFNSSGNQLAGITSLTFQQSTTGAIDIEEAPDLVSISFPNLTTIPASAYVEVGPGSPLLASVTMPSIVDGTGGISIIGPSALISINLSTLTKTNSVDFHANASLASINLSNWIPQNTNLQNNFENCALNAATVNQILARAVANAAFATGTIQLGFGTNAAPSGQGIADKATLIGRGVAVTTN